MTKEYVNPLTKPLSEAPVSLLWHFHLLAKQRVMMIAPNKKTPLCKDSVRCTRVIIPIEAMTVVPHDDPEKEEIFVVAAGGEVNTIPPLSTLASYFHYVDMDKPSA